MNGTVSRLAGGIAAAAGRSLPRCATLTFGLLALAGDGAALGTDPAGLGGARPEDPRMGYPAVAYTDLADAGVPGPVWSIAENSDGALLFGAEKLLVRAGETWLVPGTSGYAIRGLATDGQRVYLGGNEEIGYIESDPLGGSRYVSLRSEIQREAISAPKEIWNVAKTGDGNVFVGGQQILRYDGHAFASWDLPATPRLQSFGVGGELWFYQSGLGLRRLAKPGPETLFADQDLPAVPVVWALASARQDGPPKEGLLIGTSDAVYRRRQGRWEPLTALSTAVRGKLVVGAVDLGANRIAIATYLNGVVFATRDGQVEAVANHAHGLPDDHVYCLYLDQHEGLWAGLPEGAVRMRADGRESVFDRTSGLEETPVKNVLAGANGIFVATSKSVYSVQPRTAGPQAASLERNRGIESLLWDTGFFRDSLWAAGFGGIWRRGAHDSDWQPEYQVSADVFQLCPLSGTNRPLLLFTEQERLRALEYVSAGLPDASGGAGWVPRELGQQVRETPLSLVAWDHEVWVSTIKGQVRRYQLLDRPGRPTLRLLGEMLPGAGLPENAGRTALVPFGGALFAFTERGILRLDASRKSFAEEPRLSAYLGLAAAAADPNGAASTLAGPEVERDLRARLAYSAGSDQNAVGGQARPEVALHPRANHSLNFAARSYWLVQSKILGGLAAPVVVRVEMDATGELSAAPTEVDAAGAAGRIASLSVTRTEGHDVLWLGGTRHLLRVVGGERPAAWAPPSVRLTGIAVDGQPLPLAAAGGLAGGTLQSAHAHGLLLSASSTAVRFTFAAGETAAVTAAQTWLEGAEPNWTEPQQRGERTYSGLAPGHYTFHVRALDAFGRLGPELTARFDLPKLWYLTWPAMAGYAAVLALAGVAAARWRIAALERQNRILNQLVDERTRELAARSTELELSNTAKTEFLETISHEIRNPLNGIRGFIAMLREAALPTAQQELAASLATCAGALTRVFDEVLGFARIESGQLPLQRRSFSLPALVDEVVALHRVAARQRRCELRVEWDLPPGEAPAARRFIGDDDKIKTVLSNLISNAVKYAPGQPVEIAVAVEPDGPRAANLTVTVRDYGPGVPENEQDLIFKKFVRGSQAKDQRIPGTGLGLATCKVLLEQMGGFIGLESPPGEGGNGTSFFFKLWLRYDSEPAAPVRPEGNGAPAGGAVGRRALIVEDQDYNQVLTLRTVQRLGFDAEVAQDGPEAVRKLATGPYAVVFMDWELPGTKGDEIARHVRSLAWGPSAIIIATTGHDGETTRKACREAGMDAVVLKPFDDLMLAHALDEVRSQRGEAKAPAVNGDLLDLRSFALVGQGDPAKTARAAADYLGSLQQELAELDLGLQRADWRSVASTAHRLRSHAGIVAAHGLKDAAKALQEAAGRAGGGGAESAARMVRQEAGAVRRQVEMATGARAE